MGFETANVHLGTLKARTLAADLKKRPAGWLLEAAHRMERATVVDFKDYARAN
jgi:hypothetical protein